ncbi:MAG: prolyl oligopeptidase family serine peptidase, partial [Alistipes sp.]|nr:prolyl oligopeptidase family serine peptidase [Alistipes sp.]
PINLIPKKKAPAALLFCGTADITVECAQSKAFAEALHRRGAKVDLEVYENYDHNLSAKASDKMEEVFFKTVDFLTENL